jgi:hypothetical protein
VGIGAMTKNWEIKYEIIIHSAKISVEGKAKRMGEQNMKQKSKVMFHTIKARLLRK